MASILQSSVGLLRSRLSHRIVSWVFLSIVVIEVIIFIPSFVRRYREKLTELEILSQEVLFAAKGNAMQRGNPEQLLDFIEKSLKPDSVILGAVLCGATADPVDAFGEIPAISCQQMLGDRPQKHHFWQQRRYDVAWSRSQFNGQYSLIVRHNATKVQRDMQQYALAIAGLVLIISAFVTFVTIVMLERILIVPILRLRDDLRQAGDAVSQDQPPRFQTRAMGRHDELGEVSQAFCEMFERVYQEIRDRKQAERALKEEQAKSEKLLLNILPSMIAEQLKQEVGAIASRFEEATILFTDIVDFTGLSTQVAPGELVCQLNDIFSAFDSIADRLGLEKIKTIGDAYMVVGGVPMPCPNHAEAVLEMAIQMLDIIRTFQRQDGTPFQLRIGINTGPVVAGVIGIKKFSYDLWGDAVNIASRMESHGVIDRIQISDSTYQHLKDLYEFEDRGCIPIKGRGDLHTYLFKARKVPAKGNSLPLTIPAEVDFSS